jgi:hypothetical protein
MKLDENGLIAAGRTLCCGETCRVPEACDGSSDLNTSEARATITAYLAALPPTGDAGELIEKCRRYADSLIKTNDLSCGPLMARCALLEAADALTASAARIAELEGSRSKWRDLYWRAAGRADNATDRTARLEAALRETLSWLRAALDCKTWSWDDDQREAAESDYTRCNDALPPAPSEGGDDGK